MKIISGTTSKSGHYAPGVIHRGTLYISGQLPIDQETGKLAEGGAAAQTGEGPDALGSTGGSLGHDAVVPGMAQGRDGLGIGLTAIRTHPG